MSFLTKVFLFIVGITLIIIAAGYHEISSPSQGKKSNPLTDIQSGIQENLDALVHDVASTTAAGTSMMQIDGSFIASSTEGETAPTSSSASKPNDTITAYAYLVGNVKTGKVYMELRPDFVSPVASMSKLVTAIVATDTMTPTTTITISKEEASVYPDGSHIHAGETFTLKDMLYPMLLDSSNIAAEAIASSSDRIAFLKKMSGSAWEINMPTAYFADPSGLSPHNLASANDIFALAKYLYTYRPDILAITRILHISVATTTEHDAHDFDSIHPFVDDSRFIGGKTGRTPQAGETMLTILNIGGQPIAFIVLHSQYGERAPDTQLLIDKFEKLHS